MVDSLLPFLPPPPKLLLFSLLCFPVSCWTCFCLSVSFVFCGVQTEYSAPDMISQVLGRGNEQFLRSAGNAFVNAVQYVVDSHPHRHIADSCSPCLQTPNILFT